MKNEVFTNSIRFIALVLIQVLILSEINFLGYIDPYLYLIYIILFPITGNRILLILSAFFLGLTIDMFENSGGVHAASSVFIAWIRPIVLKFSFGVSYQLNSLKVNSAPLKQQILYVSIMILFHHLLLFSLEVFSTNHILLILKFTLLSSILSIVLIMATLFLLGRKKE